MNYTDPTGTNWGPIPTSIDEVKEDFDNAKDAVSNIDVTNAVQVVHNVSGVVAGVAGVCAAVGFGSVVGAAVGGACASVSAAATTVNLGTSFGLWATDNESNGALMLDVGFAGTGAGFGKLTRAGEVMEATHLGTGFFPSCKEMVGVGMQGLGRGMSLAKNVIDLVRGPGPR